MNFNESVKEIIGPLLLNKGFALKDEHNGLLHYCNNELSIKITYYAYAFEVDTTIEFKGSENAYTYSELKKCFDYKLDTNFIQITHENVLSTWLLEVQAYFVLYLDEILKNIHSTQLVLQATREADTHNYNRNRDLKMLHLAMDKFWEEKDYKGLVNFVNNNTKLPLEGIYDSKYKYSLKQV